MSNLYLLSLIVGIVTGVATFIFGTGLGLITNFIWNAYPYNLILIPFVAFLTIILRDRFKKEVDGSMPRIFQTTKNDSELSILIVPYQIVTTWFAHLAGASVGREGVAVQLGATISNVISTKVAPAERKALTRIGMAAGFAGLFGTPLAATVFCFEVTRVKKLKLNYIGATLIATFVSNFTSSVLGLKHFHVQTEFVMFDIREFIFFIFAILCFALVGHLFALGLKKFKATFAKIGLNSYLKIIVFSIVGALLLWTISQGRYMSLGTNIIDDAFYNPNNIQYFDFAFKMLFTIYFVGIGFQGGEVTPLFAIGSSLGATLSLILALPVTIVSAIGYAFVFGNATNAYIACSVLVVEVFGIAMLPYAIIALIITLFVRDDSHSIYPNLEWE